MAAKQQRSHNEGETVLEYRDVGLGRSERVGFQHGTYGDGSHRAYRGEGPERHVLLHMAFSFVYSVECHAGVA